MKSLSAAMTSSSLDQKRLKDPLEVVTIGDEQKTSLMELIRDRFVL